MISNREIAVDERLAYLEAACDYWDELARQYCEEKKEYEHPELLTINEHPV